MTEPITTRRLRPGDEAILAYLAERDAEFDLEGRGEPLAPLAADRAAAYLANPDVLHWVAFQGDRVAGSLYCVALPLRSGDGREVLLYEIGVHQECRRQGIGKRLIAEMEGWMRDNGVAEVWVLCDNPGAQAFYEACGFAVDPEQPVYMTRRV